MVKPTRELVIAKIEEMYPNRDVSEILVILDRYGDEECEKEKNRVQLAALKLSDEEGLPDPARYITAAKQEYRDVLAWGRIPQLNEI
ncbi:MAG: hypothetical protein OEU36_13570 [Gammaproteobacteria bacterium]|nr:hypothetical protein [Gammaproteobacteria bacterium]